MIDISRARILITGGTGSWGHELVRQLLSRYPKIPEIRIYSRGEHRQVDMKREFSADPRLRFIIGDIRDKMILTHAMRNVSVVFHLAALKHVPICEDNSWEAVLTNIIGTQNVIEAALENEVDAVVDVSTDKAVEPFNLYGVTKACGEKLVVNANTNYNYKKNVTKFMCIRGGNVLGTNGSVIPLFKEQILQKNEITVTDPSMTRFLMSTKEAIGLIFTAVEHAVGGEVFVMKMPASPLSIIAETMVELFGNKKTKIRTIGVRPGEKQHEVLVSKNEMPYTKEFSPSHFVILPQKGNPEIYKQYKTGAVKHIHEYTSENTKQLTKKDLMQLLKKESWLYPNNS